jgi:benzylsuccinate CoA-transferase BbsF subunit
MSQLESALQFIAPIVLDYANNGREGSRTGNRHDAAAPHGAFPCVGDDRWVTITCMNDDQWLRLRKAFGDPAWMQEPRFGTLLERKHHEDELEANIVKITQKWEAEALMHRLQAAGVPAGLVHSNKGVVEDEQLNHRGHCVYYEKAEIGRHPVQRSEFRLSKTEALRKWPTPFVGEHTRYVCGEILGMPASEIDPLIADGVLEVPPPELLAT